ncbi:hypothetical protein CQZ94_27425 [Bacillus sp. MYb209]|uniref:hypothetical protein n=1 Tax=Bacillus sp. MYb209 TaxID=1848605 RepID=UPI000CFCB009|nr:hypothetical protein [Bacillus sp. MYb209]PQZ48689.1 hypothetical protein CQZ94_27425 [Bacillus sp. MYb209]
MKTIKITSLAITAGLLFAGCDVQEKANEKAEKIEQHKQEEAKKAEEKAKQEAEEKAKQEEQQRQEAEAQRQKEEKAKQEQAAKEEQQRQEAEAQRQAEEKEKQEAPAKQKRQQEEQQKPKKEDGQEICGSPEVGITCEHLRQEWENEKKIEAELKQKEEERKAQDAEYNKNHPLSQEVANKLLIGTNFMKYDSILPLPVDAQLSADKKTSIYIYKQGNKQIRMTVNATTDRIIEVNYTE